MHLVKPSLEYYLQYKNMMDEWHADGSRIAPWSLELPYQSEADFAILIRRVEEVSRGENCGDYSPSTTWWLYDEEQDRLIGAGNLRHRLTEEGRRTWGHVGYGIRPSERRKGHAALLLKALRAEAKKLGIEEVLLAAYTSNVASWKTMEKCGAVFLRTVLEDSNDPNREIRQYILK